MRGRDLHERLTLILSWVLIAIGLAGIVVASVRGSGGGAYLLGGLFVLVGSARIWFASQRRRED